MIFWVIMLCGSVKSSYVPEENITSIFEVEEYAKQETSNWQVPPKQWAILHDITSQRDNILHSHQYFSHTLYTAVSLDFGPNSVVQYWTETKPEIYNLLCH
jgi:hypothetical protein